MSENDICGTIFCAVVPILMGIIMAFILTWQQIGFLKRDNKRYRENIREAESKIRNIEWKIRDLERDVERNKK